MDATLKETDVTHPADPHKRLWELIKHMRERVAKCRWLASMINHPEGKRTLLEMADEGEADIKKLEAEMAADPITITVGLPREE